MDWRPLGFGCTLALSRFARRLYRGRRPHILARGFNRVAAAVFARQRAPVLKAYLKRAPGARPHIPVDKDASLDEFAAIASHIPVFLSLRGDVR